MLIPKNKFHKKPRFLLFTLFFVLLFGASLTAYTHRFIDQFSRETLQNRASAIANMIDFQDIKNLSGTDADLENETYIKIKDQFNAIHLSNKDVRFVYITGKRDGKIFFYLDSENPKSQDYSPPGQIYDEADPIFHNIFNDKKAVVYGPLEDRWGKWVTAVAPIIEKKSGKVIAVVGMDTNAKYHNQVVWVYTLVPALLTFISALFILVAYRLQFHQSELFEVKSELISIASHEIRSPITGINWALENLQHAPNLSDSQKELIASLRTSTSSLMSNISDILNASSITGGGDKLNLTEIYLHTLIKEVLEQLEFYAKENQVTLNCKSACRLDVKMICDKDKLKRVLSNIVANAIKYSHSGGEVIFEYQEKPKSHLISITDFGIGIPTPALSKIFDGYFRGQNALDKNITGTGLGLYFCQKIIKLHGGKIWVTSKENFGSSFYIELPKT